MNLATVRRWALAQGVAPATFRAAYLDALVIAIARLAQAIHRERLAAATIDHVDDDHARLCLGVTSRLIVPVGPPLPFGRLDVTGLPWPEDAPADVATTGRAFLRLLAPHLDPQRVDLPALTRDFHDSLANAVLNRLLAARPGALDVPEPSFQGHTYFPFPALRVGPTRDHVVACSSLSPSPIDLPVVDLPAAALVVSERDDETVRTTWSDLPGLSALAIPIHPWHWQLSQPLRALLELGLATPSPHRVPAHPLASQRTCRVVATGVDVKLPVDAVLTGEHRLLGVANVRNAPTVSRLVAAAAAAIDAGTLTVQRDLASISHVDPVLARHLSVIFREPLATRPNEALIPALNLWTGSTVADDAFDLSTPSRCHDAFASYCEVVMQGPLELCVRHGIALEPHIQNTLVRVRDRRPAAIVLRDTDSTVLDERRVRPALRRLGLALPVDVWPAMPSPETGRRRLLHALFHGHLEVAMAHLVRTRRAQVPALVEALHDAWHTCIHAIAPAHRDALRALHAEAATVKHMLVACLDRSTRMTFHVP